MARNIYAALEQKTIFYFDKDENIENIPEVDLVIGIISPNYIKIASRNPQAKKILFLVNCHPLFRAQVLLDDSKKLHKTLPQDEWLHPSLFIRHLKYTDHMLLIGSDVIKETFTRYGIPESMITTMNTVVNMDYFTPEPSLRNTDKVRIVYVASSLGVRKGLFHVMRFWEELMKTGGTNYELIIVGGLSSFKSDMDLFLKTYSNVQFLGWIESNTERYKKLLQSAHIVIEPSLEEGQVGCVLEAMSCGAVPVISKECGIPIKNDVEGFIVAYDDYEGMKKSVAKAMENFDHLSQNARLYIEKNHDQTTYRQIIASQSR